MEKGCNPRRKSNVQSIPTSAEKPPLIESSKVKTENKILKHSIASKEIEINELKRRLKQLTSGFQMIKINSDNTHIDMTHGKPDIIESRTIKMKEGKILKEFNIDSRNQSKEDLMNSLSRVTSKEEILKKIHQSNSRASIGNKSMDFNNTPLLSRNIINTNNSRVGTYYSQKNSPEHSNEEAYSITELDDPKINVIARNFMNKIQLPKVPRIISLKAAPDTAESNNNLGFNKDPPKPMDGNETYSREVLQLKIKNSRLRKEYDESKEQLTKISKDFSQSIIDISNLKKEYNSRIKSLTNDLNFSISVISKIETIVKRQTEMIINYKREKEEIRGKSLNKF